MKIGFIGCGNMASAIISGVLSKKSFDEKDINVFDIYSPAVEKIKEKFDVNACNSETDITHNSDVVVLAVKPNVIENVLSKISDVVKEKNPLIISIAAGKSTEFLAAKLNIDARIIRVMPNINAKVGEAICAYTENELATDDDMSFCEKLFSSVGQVIHLEESYFPLFGVLGGCTPALAYMFIDELARAGVKNGMKKDVALKISAQAVLGSAKMILEANEHPYDLIDKVCSPGGTTIEAVTSLQKDGFNSAIHDAVNKALEKDKLL